MGLGGGNLDKVALVLIATGFQLHAVDMAISGKYGNGNDPDADDAIKAFLILAFIAYLAAFILSVLINFGNLDGKVPKIITLIICFVGVACTVIGISIYGSQFNNSEDIPPFSFTTYVAGFACLGTGGVLMLLAMCC